MWLAVSRHSKQSSNSKTAAKARKAKADAGAFRCRSEGQQADKKIKDRFLLPHNWGIQVAFHFFTVGLHDDGRTACELNGFLSSHKVLAVERHFVEHGGDSFWAFCVDYWQGSQSSVRQSGGPRISGSSQRVDYKERLSPTDFKIFLKLREWRKTIAQSEAVPVYAVFTNEQLAQVASSNMSSKAALGRIDGIGDARVAKYGDALLAALSHYKGPESVPAASLETIAEPQDETPRESVEPIP